MIELPQRRLFATREDYVAAVTSAIDLAWQMYEEDPVSPVIPDWAGRTDVYNVALPLDLAREGGAEHGVASIVRHAIEMRKSMIKRIAHIERDGMWAVFFEAT